MPSSYEVDLTYILVITVLEIEPNIVIFDLAVDDVSELQLGTSNLCSWHSDWLDLSKSNHNQGYLPGCSCRHPYPSRR